MANEELKCFRKQWLTELEKQNTKSHYQRTDRKSCSVVNYELQNENETNKESKLALLSPQKTGGNAGRCAVPCLEDRFKVGEECRETKTLSIPEEGKKEKANFSFDLNPSTSSYNQDKPNISLTKKQTISIRKPSFLKETSKNNREEYKAFSIANKYLNLNKTKTTCNQCSSERCTTDGGEVRSRKRKRCSCEDDKEGGSEFRSLPGGPHKRKGKESLVDLLIADIDEITSIPFFDLELPKEIAVKVFSYLSVHELASCCSVNKQWKAIAEDNLIWFNIYKDLKLNKQDSVVVDDRDNWKSFVKDKVIAKRVVQQKWRERFCEVRDLENEKGGILCAVGRFHDNIVVAYLDGSIRLWSLLDSSFGHNLKERYTSDEDIVTGVCVHVRLSRNLCVASFQNGDIMVWKRDDHLSGRLVHMINYASSEPWDISICISDDRFVTCHSGTRLKILKKTGESDQPSSQSSNASWNWSENFNHEFEDKVLDVCCIGEYVAINNRNQLFAINLHNKTKLTLDKIAGAVFSCFSYTNTHLVTAINGFGYSVLGGFRIRKYCLASSKELCNISGPQCSVTCLEYRDSLDNEVIVSCSDRTIRIFEMNSGKQMTCISQIKSDVTTLQVDDWKILSGHKDGSVSLWDRHHGTMYWQTSMKHPVNMCFFTDRFLTCVNIPAEKFPRNSNWYADDLIQHRKYRGSIRIMDFTKDILHGGSLSKEFHADYDNITGYDYNIELIAPYDNVETLNLPKI